MPAKSGALPVKGGASPAKVKSLHTKGDSLPANDNPNDNSSLVKGASPATGAVLPAQGMLAFPEELIQNGMSHSPLI